MMAVLQALLHSANSLAEHCRLPAGKFSVSRMIGSYLKLQHSTILYNSLTLKESVQWLALIPLDARHTLQVQKLNNA